LKTLIAGIALMMLSDAVSAQIIIGQTAGFTGAVAASVKETLEGAKLYLDWINTRGGVNGQSIELISLDDQFDPKIAADNAKILVLEKKAVALFLTRGTPHTEAIMKQLDALKVPLIAPSSGAMSLHRPVNPWLFNVRSTYQSEARRAISLLKAIGIDRIGVLYRDDSFGEDVAQGANTGFEMEKIKPVFSSKFDRTKPDFAQLGPDTLRTSPQAILIIGGGTEVVAAARVVRATGSRAQMVTISNNAAAGFIQSMGELGPGTVVTQVFPYEKSFNSAFVKDAIVLARARKIDLSPAMLEGYAGAMVLVEGLRRAGAKPTGERIRNALEAIRNFDLGGLDVTYSPSDHTGIEFTDLSIITKDGRFRR
jgi:branched-chain amino acid transport system substrate-binding protein